MFCKVFTMTSIPHLMDLFHFWAPRLPQRILWHLLWLNGCIETRPKYFQITAKKSSQEDAVGCKNKKQQDEIEFKKMWSICSVSRLAIAHNNSSCFFRSCRPSFRWYSWKWIFHCVEEVILLICRSLCSWSFCLRFLLAGKLNNLMGEGNVATSNQCNFV